ncbi:DUF2244 domain-containing protein [Marinobacter salinisoli]|uniref:DUF2244 domain-containing protein n=1 Tax=Marinobacter salinisoli TaxID=2769486 RepID=A0ABX7MQW8_9GAMM|nr:DUF2244 domain-containing protein [Marinobacter salinisoli]QSP94725.1 DUF2244 domain-containing protein [Marinobacter salinisoli]
MVQHLNHAEGVRLLLTPNRSLSWRGNVRIWLCVVAVTLIIATAMALAGAWVVVPFAGLELLALAIGVYLTSQSCQRQEVLTINNSDIRLEKGRRRKLSEWTLPVRYARLRMNPPEHPFAPPKLVLIHRDVHVSLGSFLNVEDTEALVRFLESRGLTIERKQPEPDPGLWF